MKRKETDQPHDEQRPVEERAADANTGGKIWLTIACAFILLCILVWLNEILDLPHFFLGAPRTPINWFDTVSETVVLVVVGLFAVSMLVRNITRRKLAEESLRASAREWSTTFDCINDAVSILNLQGKFLRCNKAMANLLGKPLSGIVNHTCWELVHGTSEPIEGCPIVRMVESHRRETLLLPIGDRWLNVTADPIMDEDGDLIGGVHIISDVTDHKLAEEALVHEKKKFEEHSRILNIMSGQMTDMVYYKDKNFRYVFSSKSHCDRILKCSQEECVGLTDVEIARRYRESGHEQGFGELCFNSDNQTRDAGKPSQFLETARIDGKEICLEVYKTPLFNEHGDFAGIVGCSRDIAERKRLERQLSHAHKMAAIGTLAGGIAHNFNNILAGIMGYASLLKKGMEKGSSKIVDMESIERLSLRGANLTKALTAFSCKGKYYPRVLSVNRLLESVMEIIGQTAGKDIEIKAEPAKEVSDIIGDDGQLYQAIMNLCLNACEAMPEGGTLTVNTADEEPEKGFFRVHPGLRKGPYVSISVSDTGGGMDAETTEHIFEPFFTTHGLAEKPGLGLSMVSSVVEGHGGCIDVESVPGKGSTFTIYLPAAREKKREATPEPVATLKGNEMILLVDDDKDFRKSTARCLNELGYTVLEAQSGDEALNLLEENKDNIDIVLLNMLMEGLSGEETFRKMRDMVPGLAVIICTGYSIDNGARQLLAEGARDFIQKPFEHDSLARKIRQVLDNR